MKKLNAMLFMALAAVFSFTSCSDDENDTAYGITGLIVVTDAGASYQGNIDQAALTIKVSVPATLQSAELESCSITASATLGTTITINGEALEGNKFDISKGLVLKATNGTESKDYTLSVAYDMVEDLAAGKLISADICGGGIPASTYAYKVAHFDGKFYAFTNAIVDTIGYYNVYTSTNGVSWTKDAAEVIGGMGATPIVWDNKLHIYSGVRFFGYDEDGNGPEMDEYEWFPGYMMTDFFTEGFRDYATDGDTWTDHYLTGDAADTVNMFNELIATGSFDYIDPILYTFNNELYMLNGHGIGYGQIQAPNRNLYKKVGDTFEPVEMAGTTQLHNTVFVLNNEVFFLGGTKGFYDASQLLKCVYKSTDGANFELAADSTAVGAIAGATVVTNDEGTAAYLFGGLQYDETGAQIMNNNIYKTTDGVNWEVVEGINPEYKGAYKPSVVVINNVAWVFGGFNSVVGYYAPYSTTIDDMDPSFAAWAFAL